MVYALEVEGGVLSVQMEKVHVTIYVCLYTDLNVLLLFLGR